MSEETSFVQWQDRAKEERKRTGMSAGPIIGWVVGGLVVLVALVALYLYLG